MDIDLRNQTVCPQCDECVPLYTLTCPLCGFRRETHINTAGEWNRTYYVRRYDDKVHAKMS